MSKFKDEVNASRRQARFGFAVRRRMIKGLADVSRELWDRRILEGKVFSFSFFGHLLRSATGSIKHTAADTSWSYMATRVSSA